MLSLFRPHLLLGAVNRQSTYLYKVVTPAQRYVHGIKSTRMATQSAIQSTLETFKLNNSASERLPVEENTENYVRSVQGACFSRIDPLPLKNPSLVAHSQSALDLLGLAPSEAERPDFVEYFSGNKLLPGSKPVAHCYCGHQFGHFAGQLGDGCALLLGDVVGPDGKRWELQFKGSGKTPYSRRADGRKVLRSSIREFLCSEAMHHLGIPTTRAGTCVTSDNRILRDIFYTGNAIQERATVITRIAPSFIRFGSFEIFKPRDSETGRVAPSVGRVDILHQLLDYVIETFYPEAHAKHPDDRPARTSAFFKEVCLRTAKLVALWQCVGFCHGVLNTDNMSILGLTIDYGPFGFLDRYEPGHICNGSDHGGRYAYDHQPAICRWNLGKLAEALSPCLSNESVKEGLEMYEAEFERVYLEKMRQKFGLIQKQLPEDSDLVEAFLEVMHKTGCDFTNGFQCLSRVQINATVVESELEKVVEYFLGECASPQELIKSFKSSMSAHQLQMFITLMQQSPDILVALGLSPEVIQSEIAKHEQQQKLKNTTSEEKREEDKGAWLSWLRTYSTRLVSELEGYHGDIEKINEERLRVMQKHNPRIVLRNHIAQKAIEMAEKGDYSEVQRVLKLLESPYDPVLPHERGKTDLLGEDQKASESPVSDTTAQEKSRNNLEMNDYFSKPPEWALGLCVT